jgi:hypothetical protein
MDRVPALTRWLLVSVIEIPPDQISLFPAGSGKPRSMANMPGFCTNPTRPARLAAAWHTALNR